MGVLAFVALFVCAAPLVLEESRRDGGWAISVAVTLTLTDFRLLRVMEALCGDVTGGFIFR